MALVFSFLHKQISHEATSEGQPHGSTSSYLKIVAQENPVI